MFIFAFICAFLKMFEGVRDTPVGGFLRLLGFNSWFPYPEEASDFQRPEFSLVASTVDGPSESLDLEKTLSKASAQIDVPEQDLKRRLTDRGLTSAIIVNWYSPEDTANPRNWSNAKKNWVLIVINLYTFVVYNAASIITPTAEYGMQRYNISADTAGLGLSMYVVGYGVGPMFFSPISEIPFIGRNPPYLYSFMLFFGASILLAVVDNWPALVVLRFLQGFFGSPILASGVASIEDIYDMYSAPYGYTWWVAAMYCGPAVGPILPAYAVDANWRWALWEIVIMAGILLLILPFLPETSPTKIILRRAQRLRKATGDNSYLAPSEVKPLRLAATFNEALMKPLEISVKDPAIGFACLYTAILYSIYYSYFEGFPIVYMSIYGMSLGGLGLVFLSIIVGCVIGVVMYYTYIRYYFIPRARKYHTEHGHPVAQEQWLKPGLVGVWGPPVGLFMFAWTARADVHWIAPTIGIVIFSAWAFLVFQSIVCYIPLTYPKYVASLLAANDFMRSIAAAVVVQFSRKMYINLGIGKGMSLLASLSFIGIIGMYFWYYAGAKMRARSKFVA